MLIWINSDSFISLGILPNVYLNTAVHACELNIHKQMQQVSFILSKYSTVSFIPNHKIYTSMNVIISVNKRNGNIIRFNKKK